MATAKISKETVDALKPGESDQFLWDRKLSGFGLKATRTGRKVYLVQYRLGGRHSPTRRVTIGPHGPLTADQARAEAQRLLAQVALGEDPAGDLAKRRNEPTVSALAVRYLAEHVATHNKSSTAAEVCRIVETRIKPELGHLRISEVTRSLVKSWHQSMHGKPYEANRALAYFSKLMSLAATEWELRPDNPCKGVRRFPEAKRERFFADDELKRIGGELTKAEEAQTYLSGCVNAIRLLAITGCRLGEVLSLRWADVDLRAR
jgi:hypothetical protein